MQMKTNNLWLSPLCSKSQIKANNGRNTAMKLLSNINALWGENGDINQRINFKAFYANPVKYYHETLALKRNNLLS